MSGSIVAALRQAAAGAASNRRRVALLVEANELEGALLLRQHGKLGFAALCRQEERARTKLRQNSPRVPARPVCGLPRDRTAIRLPEALATRCEAPQRPPRLRQ